MENETWKDIPGFEEKYQASTLGNIRSKNRAGKGVNSTILGLVLKPCISGKNRRLQVVLYKNKVGHNKSVHSLIALAFLGQTPMGKEIDHINENGLDNKLSNLQFLTPKQNIDKHYKSIKEIRGGVYFDKSKGKWMVMVYVDGKRKNIGRFIDKEKANIRFNKMGKPVNKE